MSATGRRTHRQLATHWLDRQRAYRALGWVDSHGDITPRGEAAAEAALAQADIACRLEEEATEYGYDAWTPDESAWSI